MTHRDDSWPFGEFFTAGFGPRAWSFDFGGCGPQGRRRGRRQMFEAGEMKYVILRLLREKPRHGYEVIRALEKSGFVPVIAPIGVGEKGEAYNINGDTVAAEVAGALAAEKLILLTDVAGVRNGRGELVSTMTARECEAAIGEGSITGGMIPKVECGLTALGKGVRKVHILDGRVPHSVLLEIFTDDVMPLLR